MSRLVAQLVAIDDAHAIGHQLGFRPVLTALRLAAHPDADVRIALLGATKVSGHKVALLGFDNAGRVALRETGLLVQELVADHLLTTLRQLVLEVVSARTYLHGTVGQMDVRRRISRYLHVPVEASMLFLPTAYDLAVDRVVAGIDIVNLVDREVGYHIDMPEAQIADSDAGNVFI